jgi:hypothetical protein
MVIFGDEYFSRGMYMVVVVSQFKTCFKAKSLVTSSQVEFPNQTLQL